MAVLGVCVNVIAGLPPSIVLALETAACTSVGKTLSEVTPTGRGGPATTVNPSTKGCEVCEVMKESWVTVK